MKCPHCDKELSSCALEELEEAIAPLTLSETQRVELIERFRNEFIAPWRNVENGVN